VRTFAVNIPTKPYLRKYIHKRYGHPIPLNHRTLIGSVILSYLQKKVYSDRSSQEDLRNTFSQFTERIECVIPQNEVIWGTGGLNIEVAKVLVINRYFGNQFEEDLYHFCQRNITPGRYAGYDRALDLFAKRYDIEFEEDITFEALKKMEYRYRKSFEQNLTAIVPPSGSHTQMSIFA
jgi:hypothetical protein